MALPSFNRQNFKVEGTCQRTNVKRSRVRRKFQEDLTVLIFYQTIISQSLSHDSTLNFLLFSSKNAFRAGDGWFFANVEQWKMERKTFWQVPNKFSFASSWYFACAQRKLWCKERKRKQRKKITQFILAKENGKKETFFTVAINFLLSFK